MGFKQRNTLNVPNRAQINRLIAGSQVCVVLQNESQTPLNSNDELLKFSKLTGLGVKSEIIGAEAKDLVKLKRWLSNVDDYVLGYFSYDLKNSLENLKSSNVDSIGFYNFHFFVPQTIIIEDQEGIRILSHDEDLILAFPEKTSKSFVGNQEESITQEEYVANVGKLKAHIQQGDIYEVNYCVEHMHSETRINPHQLYLELQESSPAPFSCFVADNGRYLMSSSPERFLKNTAGRLVSEPMKGTNRRIADNELQKQRLKSDSKEVAENVMITDLVRNDLSKSAKKGTVKVNELCEVYEFKHVNQMISRVTADMQDNLHPLDAILNAFPMGSMTGAPKISAMKLIDEFEDFSRGLYSGAVGYFTPELDFDFNVVIRSVLYNSESQVLTYPTGGAITIKSDPNKEYEECMLKAEAMRNVLLNHAK